MKKYSQLDRNSALGFIVGTYLKEDGRVGNPVDHKQVKRLVEALEGR